MNDVTAASGNWHSTANSAAGNRLWSCSQSPGIGFAASGRWCRSQWATPAHFMGERRDCPNSQPVCTCVWVPLVQEQGEADKARLKQQQEEEQEANRRQHDKIQAEKALVEAALERLELENRERAESIRQAEAAAAKARATELAAEDAKKRDIILQLRLVCWNLFLVIWAALLAQQSLHDCS